MDGDNMTELKTLKDIDYEINILELDNSSNKLYSDTTLRAEAIKWIEQAYKCGCDECRHTAISFMDFFNIPEEDLKGEQTK